MNDSIDAVPTPLAYCCGEKSSVHSDGPVERTLVVSRRSGKPDGDQPDFARASLNREDDCVNR